MKQENSQPVKQHKKKNGFADRKLLAGLVFAEESKNLLIKAAVR